MRRFALVALMTTMFLVAGGGAGASRDAVGLGPQWVATGLGNPSQFVTVADINNRGQVVGGRLAKGVYRGFVWQNGQMTALGRGRFADAKAINEAGQIVGKSGSAALARAHPVLWEQGRMTDLRLRGGATAINERGQILVNPYMWQNGKLRRLGLTSTPAINNRGQVAGAIYDRTRGRPPSPHAAVWQNGRITNLGSGYAVDINDRGEVLGQRGERVIVWRIGKIQCAVLVCPPTGVLAEIDIGPGIPIAINERGQVTGIMSTPAGDTAFFWEDGITTNLGTLGGSYSFPTGISNRGQVVGVSQEESGLQHAFVWQSGTMTELASPKKTGPDAARTRAIAINEHNQIIGDNYCIQADCANRDGSPRSKFAVIWTMRRG